ncbi:MAG: hypothetical protein IK015_00415 [Treponema sp.]|nr:hypothetical protein [Treponema sp.]
MDLKIVPSVFDYDTYLTEIKNTLSDDKTIYYLDTCFISQMYKLNLTIRSDFYKWINTNINYIKFPHWCYCEYLKRAVNSEKLKEFYPLSRLKEKVNNLNSDFQLLKYFIDDEKVHAINFSNKEEFVNKLNETSKFIETVAKSFKNNEEIESIRDEINNFLPKIVIKNEVIPNGDLKKEFDIRIENKIPPGFDEDKQTNVIGDFIIWKEIINDCKTNSYSKVVFLTNDMKKDWVYTPQKIKYLGRTVQNFDKEKGKFLPAKIADARLVKEFLENTNAQKFYILNFNLFCTLISDINPSVYANLENYTGYITSDIEKAIENDTSDTEIISMKDSSGIALGIESYGIADSMARISTNQDYQDVIDGFKSYNWYKQSSALFNAKSLDFSKLTNTEIFILGRNIYQSACGGENDAAFLLNNPSQIKKYFIDENVQKYIVMGMLFEVYFDNRGELRKELKNRYLQKLFTLISCYSEEFKNVGEYLKSKTNNFVYYLESDCRTKYSFELQIKEKISEEERKFNEIESIKINGHEILFDKYDEHYGSRYLSLTRDYYIFDSLKDIFSTNLCIPLDLVQFENHTSELKNLTIKKWVKIDSKENHCYKLLEE